MDYGTALSLLRIKQLQTRVFERLLQDSGVEAFNGPRGWILCALWAEDDVPIAELSRRTGLARNTLTVMLTGMEEAGLVTRTADETDRRHVRIRLTEKAHALEADCERMAKELDASTFSGFTEEERCAFQDMLSRMASNLDEAERRLKKKRSGTRPSR